LFVKVTAVVRDDQPQLRLGGFLLGVLAAAGLRAVSRGLPTPAAVIIWPTPSILSM
jgi:hypothetical protein